MINSKLSHVQTLEDFNSEIIRQQEEAHGIGYCDIHKAIKKYLKNDDVYMEFGVHQGGTASTAMLAKPKSIILVDIKMAKYNMFLSPIANKWCEENNIELKVKQTSSIDLGSLNYCDVLMIDSVHTHDHMTAELSLHGGSICKYIIAHDTSRLFGRPNDVLFRVLENFAKANKWEIIERGTDNVGYTVLKK